MTNSQDFGTYPAVGESSVAGDYPAVAYPAGGYGASAAPTAYTPTDTQESPSTTDVAKEQAAGVAGGASDAAQHVAGVAREQAGQVTAEAGRQVKQLVGQAQSELSDQAQVQQQKLAGGLHAVGDQLKSMANNSQEPGLATDLAHQAADRAHQVAGWLDGRDPGAVLDEVRSYARKRPGMFLAVALGAGLLAGRLARGLAADPDEADTEKSPSPRLSAAGNHQFGTSTAAPVELEGTAYGTGQVPDWTGRPADGLGDGR